ENCAKIDESSGLRLRLICCHRHGWPPESFLATSLCHRAGRYSPLMGSQEQNTKERKYVTIFGAALRGPLLESVDKPPSNVQH
ncbi:hypothetical protein, partial [Neorhizobium petrolearium]|uniref:hypothetical protein n=1 Tax=Neorhizobium petrolearium TaxID=515361 RepID=UPI003F176DA6